MKICIANITELDEILSIYENARQFMRENGNPDQWSDKHPTTQAVLFDIENRKLCTVKDDDGNILGVFFFDVTKDSTYNYIFDGDWLNDEEYGVIHRIAVSPDAHGKGVAQFCFEYASSLCKNIRIDTHENNIPMQKALLKFGFVRCGKIYVRDYEERIAFQKIVK